MEHSWNKRGTLMEHLKNGTPKKAEKGGGSKKNIKSKGACKQ